MTLVHNTRTNFSHQSSSSPIMILHTPPFTTTTSSSSSSSNTLRMPSHSQCIWLPMKLISSNGGQFSRDYPAENALAPDSSVYCTSRTLDVKMIVRLDYEKLLCDQPQQQPLPQTTLNSGHHQNHTEHEHAQEEEEEEEMEEENEEFEYQNLDDIEQRQEQQEQEQHFVLTHVLIKAPEFGYTSPVGTGSIYIHHSLRHLDRNRSNNDDNDDDEIGHDDDQMDDERDLSQENRCCTFSLQDKNYCTMIPLRVPRWGKYITIHLTGSRIGSEGNNIDVQYIGFKGFVGAHSFAKGVLL